MNTQEWLQKVISDKAYMLHWLNRQWIGEAAAASRIKALAESAPEKFKPVLQKIARDEATHAAWVGTLLQNRGLMLPEMAAPESRYWKPILSNATSFDTMAAAGFHAEGMRLVRIRALASCEQIDADIREVFQKILPDEEYHEKAFGVMASDHSKEVMREKHNAGLELLGLEI